MTLVQRVDSATLARSGYEPARCAPTLAAPKLSKFVEVDRYLSMSNAEDFHIVSNFIGDRSKRDVGMVGGQQIVAVVHGGEAR